MRLMRADFSSRSLVRLSRIVLASPSPLMIRISAWAISLAFSSNRSRHATTSMAISSLVKGSRERERISFWTVGSAVVAEEFSVS